VAATRTAEANQTATAVAGDGEPEGPINDLFPSTIIHTVQWGETVSILAARYGSTIQAIAEANGLDENYLIRVGQGLIIPVRLPAPATSTPTNTPVVVVVTATPGGSGGTTPPSSTTYVVQFGDTLSQIAQRFNTTVRTLAQLNGIVNVNSIQVGQVLRLPGSGSGDPPAPTPAPVTRYVVQPGDSLYRISLLHGVSIAELIQANNITNPNFIFVGQTLIIP
jgi:LysM repeat protein